MFSLKTDAFGQFEQLILQHTQQYNMLRIVPSFGANLLELCLAQEGKYYQLIDAAISDRELEITHQFHSAWLFPFPNRLEGGHYQYEGENYQFDCNEENKYNAIHGNIFNQEFVLVDHKLEADSGSITLRHTPSETEKAAYPFDYQLEITFILHQVEGLICKVRVQNLGEKTMPFGLGWHPYFSLVANIDFLELQLPQCDILELDNNLIPNGSRESYQQFQDSQIIQGEGFDSLFQIDLKSSPNKASSVLYNPKLQIAIEIWQETGNNAFNYLQVFTPPNRSSIAIEPMTCPANALNSGEGLIWLTPQESWEKQLGVRLYLRH